MYPLTAKVQLNYEIFIVTFVGIRSRVPNSLAANNNRAAHLLADMIPTTMEAVRLYEANGGRLNRESYFGVDPLRDREEKMASRERIFQERNPPFDIIFNELVNGNSTLFEEPIITFIDISHSESRRP